MVTGIELERAVELLTEGIVPLGSEHIPAEMALGRILDEIGLVAPIDQPPFDRSPLDGYALRAADSVGASKTHPVHLKVIETVYAGQVPQSVIKQGEAVRIMTGAMIPVGADCVLRQEDTAVLDNGDVAIYCELYSHQNYIDRGEDFCAGTVLLPGEIRLDAAAIGVLASAGICEVTVKKRPTVAVLTTGDEVVQPDIRPLPTGKIYSANAALLTARLQELGIPVSNIVAEHIGDNPQVAAEVMSRLLKNCDLLITTGGVSVGDKDILHQALPLLGAERVFWRVHCKPGTPAMFSRYNNKPVLSLSGNPFAAIATFELLARPLLAALSRDKTLLPSRRSAVLNTPFEKSSAIRRFIRGRYRGGRVTLPTGHSSGVLSSLVGCNCLVDIPAGNEGLSAGDNVQVLIL